MSENSQHSISQKFNKQNDLPRMKSEVSSSANRSSQSSNPLQEEAKKSAKQMRSSLRRSSRKISLSGSAVLQNLKLHQKLRIQAQNNNKPSMQAKPSSEMRNSKFKIRIPGDSSKHLPYQKQNSPIQIAPQDITKCYESNKQQKFISESCKQKQNCEQKQSQNVADRRQEGIAEDSKCDEPAAKELDKQFDEQSQILELNSMDEEKESEDVYVEQEVAYLIRIHLAPIVGPSLEMPARMESFQVNIQYECTAIQKFLISSLLEISEIGDETIAKDEQVKKDEAMICSKQDEMENIGINEQSLNNEDPLAHKMDESEDKKSRCRSLSVSRSNNINDKQKGSVQEQENLSKGHVVRKPNLKQIGNVFSHKICPSQFTQKAEKPRLLSESLQSSHASHRIFKSHPFLDKALKNRNKILPKNMSNEKENELSIPEHRSGQKTKMMESDQLKAKRIIKKRNINELKLKQIIQQAKNQVMVQCKEVQI